MDKLRLLLLEDMPTDAMLVMRILERSGISLNATVVDNKTDFIAELDENIFDIILSDNSLPQFSAIEALQIYNKKKLDIPFILVTGSISEEYAVGIMKEGVYDYILKDRLQRLPNAVVNALNKCRAERERKKYFDEIIANESLMREAEQLAHYGSWEADLVNGHHRWSDEQYRILGYVPGEVTPSLENFFKRIHRLDLDHIKAVIDETIKYKTHEKYDFRVINSDDTIKYISAEMVVKRDEMGSPFRVNGFIRDISEIRLAEMKEKQITADLLQRNKDLEQFSYIVSHNLRSPVANIVGISNAIADFGLTEAEKNEFMEELVTSVKKLDNVIIDLNDILQIRNHVNESSEKVKFSEILNDIKSGIIASGDNKGVMISGDFTEIDEISTLKSYIHSIFYNLISNSIKFRQHESIPVIEIKSKVNAGKIELAFKDNGIGIDVEKNGKYMFGLYKRFHPGYAEGRGMGLFMVKTQVESLGGKISLQSKINQGTEFKIEFD